MLTEDQVRLLLNVCEKATGQRLASVRGKLRGQERLQAIWELLVLEASLGLGEAKYEETTTDGTPDIYIRRTPGRNFLIEAAFLRGRFTENDKKADRFLQALYREARCWTIRPQQLHCRFDGKPTEQGMARQLPEEHRIAAVMRSSKLRRFFEQIRKNRDTEALCDLHPEYTVRIHYLPKATGPYVVSSGVVEEAPRSLKEHAIYRTLSKKRRPDLNEPYIICLGGDGNGVLGTFQAPNTLRREEVVRAFFTKHASVSAVILVAFETPLAYPVPSVRRATPTLFINPNARLSLSADEQRHLRSFNFNQWVYQTWSLRNDNPQLWQTRGGPMTLKQSEKSGVVIELPRQVLLELLAGKIRSLEASYNENPFLRMLQEDRPIINVTLTEADIRSNRPANVAIEFGPPFESIFSNRGNN